jgi:hypothetical protein
MRLTVFVALTSQVIAWRNTKGVWPAPRDESERKLIHEAFVAMKLYVEDHEWFHGPPY